MVECSYIHDDIVADCRSSEEGMRAGSHFIASQKLATDCLGDGNLNTLKDIGC